jgi:UDP-2,4-diacetamido-2,4,6-trideoxy-beta-L-altropyranose hydrolase
MREIDEEVSSVTLRRAAIEDVRLLYDWRNDTEVRLKSLNTKPLDWDEHVDWLTQRLVLTHNETIWIVEDSNDDPYGSGRILLTDDGLGMISVVIAPDKRGQGLGRQLIVLLADKIRQMKMVPVARIVRGNVASLKAFTSSGFRVYEDDPERDYVEMRWL